MERLIHVLIYAGVAIALFSTIGILIMEDVNEKLHYLSPLSILSVGLILRLSEHRNHRPFDVRNVICRH